MPELSFTSFLDNVEEPQNFNLEPAPLDLLVSDLFLKLESTNSENKAPFSSVSAKKVNIIEQFVATWRTHIGDNIYPAVRLIFPNRDGRKYHIKDVALTRLVTKLLDLQPGLNDYLIIKNWKRSYHQKAQLVESSERRQLSDLPLIIARIILRRRDQNSLVKSTASVQDVNDTLDKLTQLTQSNDQVELLTPFLKKLTIPEVRCFFQMVLKESMLSFFERSFFIAWHPDAYDLFKVCDDMKKIFWLLYDPAKRLEPNQLCVQPMYSFIPQSSKKLEISYADLCKRMTVPMAKGDKDEKLVKMYESQGIAGKYLIEEKIDGDRMLMHMVDGNFKWHTRRRRDYTLVYGESVHLGSLTKYLRDAFHENVKSIILDGEMVAWSKDRELILPFGTLRSAAIQEALKQFEVVDVYEGNNSWPLFIIFDVLHLNGRDLSNLPLFYRKDLLNKVVKEVPHRFERLQWVTASTPDDLKANMQRIVSEQNEGIMVKSLLLKYRVYSRDSTWIKVKPEYLENFGENLDLVVIGKIGRIKTSYICGLKDDDEGGCYKLFCRVANGFLNTIYRQIESKLTNFWVDYSMRKPEKELLQFGTVKPDFWINPANLIVLEIKARSIEVTAETPYAAGSTLHNLWCRAVREDKGYDECITLQEYRDLKSRYSVDIYKKQDVNRSRKRAFDNSIYVKYDRSKRRTPAPESQLFSDLHFVVATDYRDEETGHWYLNEQVQAMVSRNGGMLELNPKTQQLFHKRVIVLGQAITPRLKRWVEEGFDVLSPKWVISSVRAGTLEQLEPQFLVATHNDELTTLLKSRVDEYGDSYRVNRETSRGFISDLRRLNISQQLGERSHALCAERWLREEKKLRKELFLDLNFYVVAGLCGVGRALCAKIVRKILRFGGSVVDSPMHSNYVVVPSNLVLAKRGREQVSLVSRELGANHDEGTRLPSIVTDNFVADSVAAGVLVDSGTYNVAR